jgi:hypothetical protein
MKTQKTMKLRKGVEVLCREDEPGAPFTCGKRTEAEEKAAALGAGWTVYQGEGPEFYIARKKGVAKYEQLLIAELSEGVKVLAVGGGESLGKPRCWGGANGEANALRNAKALGTDWIVYQVKDRNYLAQAGQFKARWEGKARPKMIIGKPVKLLPYDEIKEMYFKLANGKPVIAVTPEEKESKAAIERDIAFAKKKGYQIYLPDD